MVPPFTAVMVLLEGEIDVIATFTVELPKRFLIESFLEEGVPAGSLTSKI